MRVGFVGLGDIGMPMAQRLIDRGFELVASDLDEKKTSALAEAGAAVGDVESLGQCAVVCIAVSDDDAVRSVIVDSGLLDRLAGGAVILVHSTILPSTARELASRAADRGITVIDAPVSGGAARARTGELAIMTGRDAPDVGAAAPVLDALAATQVHIGPSGTGAAVKLVNQLAMLAALGAIQEGLELARAFGAEEEAVLSALAAGTGDSWVVRNWGFFDDLARRYDAAGVSPYLRPWSKDLWDTVATARVAHVQMPLAGLLSQYLAADVEAHAHRLDDEEVRQ
jgi:3-hydroxyisobutyrate dehydrogenase